MSCLLCTATLFEELLVLSGEISRMHLSTALINNWNNVGLDFCGIVFKCSCASKYKMCKNPFNMSSTSNLERSTEVSPVIYMKGLQNLGTHLAIRKWIKEKSISSTTAEQYKPMF